MKPYRYLALFALLVASSLPGTARADEELTIEPWHNDFSQARYLIERGRNSEARDRLKEIVDEYEFDEVLDRASSMYSETYLRERRYDEAIDFMEDALEARGDATFEQTRRLYTATERRIRRARNRARVAVEALEDRYEDISWWNVFKIFDKLGRRKDLKDAEKDLEELEDLHRSFDPRYLFPVPALTVSPEEDGLEDEESSDEASDADTGSEAETEESGDDSEKAEVTEESSDGEEASTEESEEASDEAAEAAAEGTEAEEGTDAEAAASTDAEAEETADATDATDTEATDTDTDTEADTEATDTESTDEAMNRDTAKEVLAEEIAALVALIPEDQLDQADAILGGSTASEEESGEAEESTDELETESVAASEETTPAPEGEEATEEPGEESSAEPTEGTLELLPSSPDSSSTSATAEVAATEEVAETTAADVATLGSLREQYYAAYQALQQALVTGDQEAIKAARQTYLTSVQAMQGTRAAATGGSTAETTGPAAPTTSTTGTPSTTDSAASVDAGGPSAPGAIPAPAGSGVNPTGGFIRRDRAGIQRGVSDGGIRTSRGSLRR